MRNDLSAPNMYSAEVAGGGDPELWVHRRLVSAGFPNLNSPCLSLCLLPACSRPWGHLLQRPPLVSEQPTQPLRPEVCSITCISRHQGQRPETSASGTCPQRHTPCLKGLQGRARTCQLSLPRHAPRLGGLLGLQDWVGAQGRQAVGPHKNLRGKCSLPETG